MPRSTKWNMALACCSGVVALGAYIYWRVVCGGYSCEEFLIRDWLRPLMWGGLSLFLISAPFIFLPARMFRMWALWIFSWAFPFSTYSVVVTQNDSALLGKSDVAILLSALFGIVSIAFVILYMVVGYIKVFVMR